MSSNLVVQIVSLLLWVVALAGLKINPEQVADQTVTAITTQNWSLFLIVLFNLGNSIWQWAYTWKTNRPNIAQFLRSPNWWISFCNILFAWLAYKGVQLPQDASETIVRLVFDQQWWALAGFLIPNVLGPVIRFFTAKKTATT